MIFPLTAVAPIAVPNVVDIGLGADGEAIEVLRILTKLMDGSYASQVSFHSIPITNPQKTCGGT